MSFKRAATARVALWSSPRSPATGETSPPKPSPPKPSPAKPSRRRDQPPRSHPPGDPAVLPHIAPASACDKLRRSNYFKKPS